MIRMRQMHAQSRHQKNANKNIKSKEKQAYIGQISLRIYQKTQVKHTKKYILAKKHMEELKNLYKTSKENETSQIQ